jgi:hypothetical protein
MYITVLFLGLNYNGQYYIGHNDPNRKYNKRDCIHYNCSCFPVDIVIIGSRFILEVICNSVTRLGMNQCYIRVDS